MLQFGFALWIAYGVSLGNLTLIVPNSAAFLVGVVTMLVAWRYRAGAAYSRSESRRHRAISTLG